MSLKLEYHSNWNITKFVMTLKMECHSNRNVTQNGVSPKLECHSKWNVSSIGLSIKLEQNGISLIEYQLNWNFTQIVMSHKLKWYLN